MTRSLDIVVLLGGVSSERDISLMTGQAVIEVLRGHGHSVREFDTQEGAEKLFRALSPKPDVVFNALHGRFGEDGRLQGILDFLEMPYTHSGLLASALAMDKPAAKRLFREAGIQCPDHLIVDTEMAVVKEFMPRPYVIKPLNNGSSLGVHIINNDQNFQKLIEQDWGFGNQVMIERYIPGREITVAVMGDRALGVTELYPTSEFYDFSSKYTEGKTKHVIPADIPGAISELAMQTGLLAHKTLGCRGITRSDFRYNDNEAGKKGLYLLELNTQPGLTPLSLVPEQAAFSGIAFHDLVNWMVENAKCDR